VSELSEPAAVGFDEKGDGGGVKDINEAEILGIKGNEDPSPPPPRPPPDISHFSSCRKTWNPVQAVLFVKKFVPKFFAFF
jgi:hypothetical protein